MLIFIFDTNHKWWYVIGRYECQTPAPNTVPSFPRWQHHESRGTGQFTRVYSPCRDYGEKTWMNWNINYRVKPTKLPSFLFKYEATPEILSLGVATWVSALHELIFLLRGLSDLRTSWIQRNTMIEAISTDATTNQVVVLIAKTNTTPKILKVKLLIHLNKVEEIRQ